MNRISARFFSLLSLCLALGMFVTGSSQAAGLLTPNDGITPALKIKQHHVDVVIEDGYAITKVEQVFSNPHANDLEAIYSFPVPEKGTVAEFTVWIDGKPVTGEVLQKQQARQIYETEKQAGRDAGLTEKDSYKTFDISVSPVRAGQDLRIRFVYLQPAHVDTGIGRYLYPLEEGRVDEQKNAFWSGNDVVEEQFSFNVDIRSGYPLDAVRMPHQSQAIITQHSAGEWNISLGMKGGATEATLMDNEEAERKAALIPTTAVAAYSLDKDLVVYWRHQEGLPGVVDLVTHKPDANSRGTFMLTVTPGDDLQKITEGRDWVFVLDISGSMKGKYATLAAGVQRALQRLNPQDRFRIVLFNNRANELTRGFENATLENINHYINALVNVKPGGGTNLYAGIKHGIK
ncbi:Inter-alpha-trypsin inhibitor heavy chain H3 precursor [hydrothermal vent metagenome]|uniref:Inter-alpha-trypsin inhibitor heavy chain H3 n=1 Tax=hydrothermal vent metagenome TaxID=652676 RepID=A0A3B0ZMQ2_9ZZZZ